jgi:hypothetical protein
MSEIPELPSFNPAAPFVVNASGQVVFNKTPILPAGGPIVSGPGASVIGHLATWADAAGSVLADSGAAIPGAGIGDVTGPAGATAGAAVIFSGATGKLVADSKVILTPPATGATLTIGGGKTLQADNSVRFTSAGDVGILTTPNTTATLLSTDDIASMFTPLNPSGSTGNVMMGLGATVTVTPKYSTRLLVTVTGQCSNTAAGGSAGVTLRHGTGAAPANGAGLAGTVLGAGITASFGIANFVSPIAFTGIVTGATLGTARWFDLSLSNGGAGTATIGSLTFSIVEI